MSLLSGIFEEFTGFDFPGLTSYCIKEPDACLTVRHREFPLVAFEAGWTEKEHGLIGYMELMIS